MLPRCTVEWYLAVVYLPPCVLKHFRSQQLKMLREFFPPAMILVTNYFNITSVLGVAPKVKTPMAWTQDSRWPQTKTIPPNPTVRWFVVESFVDDKAVVARGYIIIIPLRTFCIEQKFKVELNCIILMNILISLQNIGQLFRRPCSLSTRTWVHHSTRHPHLTR